jgi:hypothetical protein
MLGIGAEKWFSLFKRGVELLADMSTFQFSATTPAMESRGQLPRPLQTGNVKGKIPHGRQILVQKAKAASSRRQHLGMASHNKWAWRPTETGHGVQENILQLGENMVQVLFSHRCDKHMAKAASDWIATTAKWHELPWYEPILGYLQSFRQPATKQGGCKWPLLSKIAKQPAMVAKAYDKSQSLGFNNARCDSSIPLAQQPFIASLLQKSGGNKTSMGNNPGIFGGWCHKRNYFASGKTFNPLVCDKEGRKAQVDYKLQRAQQLPGAKTVQVGKLARNFSLFKERDVGCKNRFEARLFSPATCRQPKALHVHPSGTKNFPIPSSMLWSKHIATTMAKCDESVPEKVEKTGVFNLGVPGRHPFGWKQSTGSAKPIANYAERLRKLRDGCKPKEIPIGAHTASGTFRFHGGFKKWPFASASGKDEEHQKGTWKNFDTLRNELQENGSNSWSHQKFFNGNALSKGVYRPTGAICKPARTNWLGQKTPNSFSLTGTSKGNGHSNGSMERKNFSRENPSEGTSFRFLPGSLGGSRCNSWSLSPGILERKKLFAHKCEGIGSSHKHSAIFSTAKGTCPFKSGQFSHLLVSNKGGGKILCLNQQVRPFLKWCMEK